MTEIVVYIRKYYFNLNQSIMRFNLKTPIKLTMLLLAMTFVKLSFAQEATPQQIDQRIYQIIQNTSAERIEADIRTLANFGTRNTFSDTVSNTRGIGAARRWIKAEFEKISAECDNCLEVFYQKDFVEKTEGSQVPHSAWIVNVVAVLRGTGLSRFICDDVR